MTTIQRAYQPVTARDIANLALEYWQGSGAKTADRLETLITWVVTTYRGHESTWDDNAWRIRREAIGIATTRVHAQITQPAIPSLEPVRETELVLPQLACPEQPFTLTAPP